MDYNFSQNQIIDLLQDSSKNEWLFKLADNIRKKYVGDDIHLRGLIEFSNICNKKCQYCGLQLSNKNIERYRMTKDEIILCAKNAKNAGYKTVVLQSGEDNYNNTEYIVEIIKEIKKLDIALTLSIGEKTYDEYKEYKLAGADRYLIRIETTDEKLYEQMHPNSNFKNRLNCIENLKKLGFEVGTGCLVGLKNQTIESLANDILFFKEIDADMVGIGPFISHKNTPLKNEPNGDFMLSLKVMALTRILLKDINIPATTAMETIHQNGRIIALQAGANVIMPNITPKIYQEKYEIYPNKKQADENIVNQKKIIEEKLFTIQRTISTNIGNRIKNKPSNYLK